LKFLNEFDFNIKHIKGKENKVMNALNRRVHEIHDATIRKYCIYLKRKKLERVALDQHYAQVIEGL